MNHRESKSPQHSGESGDSISEAGALFDALKAEARSRAEDEADAARSRSRFGRVLLTLTISAALFAAGTMIYGAYMFPDAPIRAVDGGYAGKSGAPKSQSEFESFVAWKTTLVGAFGAASAFAIAFVLTEARRRRYGRRQGA